MRKSVKTRKIRGGTWLALAVIIFAVVLVTLGKYLFPARSEATPCKAAK